jgi:hypothetical protein
MNLLGKCSCREPLHRSTWEQDKWPSGRYWVTQTNKWMWSLNKIFLTLQRKFQKKPCSLWNKPEMSEEPTHTPSTLIFEKTLLYNIGTKSLSKSVSGLEMAHSSFIRRLATLLPKQNKIKHIFFYVSSMSKNKFPSLYIIHYNIILFTRDEAN